MSAYICTGMTVNRFMLESILREEGKGVGITETEKQSEGVRGRHIHTKTPMCY